ncbi:MAG: hypothetical protein VXV91_06215 [Verrucomicrobiota bacterium]|nr:hypothetical protein [Verrucomicrobiota bacterium]
MPVSLKTEVCSQSRLDASQAGIKAQEQLFLEEAKDDPSATDLA